MDLDFLNQSCPVPASAAEVVPALAPQEIQLDSLLAVPESSLSEHAAANHIEIGAAVETMETEVEGLDAWAADELSAGGAHHVTHAAFQEAWRAEIRYAFLLSEAQAAGRRASALDARGAALKRATAAAQAALRAAEGGWRLWRVPAARRAAKQAADAFERFKRQNAAAYQAARKRAAQIPQLRREIDIARQAQIDIDAELGQLSIPVLAALVERDQVEERRAQNAARRNAEGLE